jgi:hypothetical protein
VITDVRLGEAIVPGPGGYRRQARIDLRRATGAIERERAPLVRIERDGVPIGAGRPQPATPGTCWDEVGEARRHHYRAAGTDLFGRTAPAMTGVDLDVDAADLPAPPAPALVTAAWTPAGTYRVGWLWSPERRRLFPEVDRFRVAVDGVDAGPEVPLAARVPVTITPAVSRTLTGALTSAPTATELPGGPVATLATDLAVAETALGLFGAGSPGVTFEVQRDGAWVPHEVVEHTVGASAAFVVRADGPWADPAAGAPVRLTYDRPDVTGVWRVEGGDGRPFTAGVLGDARGAAYPILVAAPDGAVLVLHRSGDGVTSAAPASGAAAVAFPQTVELDRAVTPDPDPAIAVRRPAFTVAALTADGRRGAASAPALVTRVLSDVPPTLAAPSARLLTMPDLHHRSRVAVGWTLPAPEYRCEVLRISAPQVALVLAGSGAGDADLPALLAAGGDTAVVLERAFELVGSTAPGADQLDDGPTTTGVRLWYAVRALDAAGNRGALSPVSPPVVPPDVRAPDPPAGLRTRRDGERIEVSWAVPATPDVDGYRVLRSAQARPPSPMLLAVAAPGVAAESEPLRVHAGRVVLPGFTPGADRVERVSGDADLTSLVLVTAAGDALQPLWTDGLAVVVESTSAGGEAQVHGLAGEPILVAGGAVDLAAVPPGSEVTGVLPRHLVRLDDHGRPADRATLPDLRDGGVPDPDGSTLRSVEREGTRWLVELAAVDDPGRRRYLNLLEEGGERPVELREGTIPLPFWDDTAERLHGLFCFSETLVGGDPPRRRPAPGAPDRLGRFTLDPDARCLRPAWRDGVEVAVHYRRADGSTVEHRVDPARRRLSEAAAAGNEPRYYAVQARRSVGGAAVWSAMSEPSRHHEPADRARPVWVTARWNGPPEAPRHLLAWRTSGAGVQRLLRRAKAARAWSALVELEPVDGVVRARVPGGDWTVSADWTGAGGLLAGTPAEVDPTSAWDYRVERVLPDGPRTSPAVRIPAQPDGAVGP